MTPDAQLSRLSTRQSPASMTLAVLGRFCFSLIFIMSILSHFSAKAIAMAAAQGVPLPSIGVPLSGVIASLGGLLVLLGYRARWGAWLIVIFLVLVTPIMHRFWGVADPMMHQMQMINFMKNVSMLGAALLITQIGSGPASLDGGR